MEQMNAEVVCGDVEPIVVSGDFGGMRNCPMTNHPITPPDKQLVRKWMATPTHTGHHDD